MHLRGLKRSDVLYMRCMTVLETCEGVSSGAGLRTCVGVVHWVANRMPLIARGKADDVPLRECRLPCLAKKSSHSHSPQGSSQPSAKHLRSVAAGRSCLGRVCPSWHMITLHNTPCPAAGSCSRDSAARHTLPMEGLSRLECNRLVVLSVQSASATSTR